MAGFTAINNGAVDDDGTGEALRAAFGKLNNMLAELYAAVKDARHVVHIDAQTSASDPTGSTASDSAAQLMYDAAVAAARTAFTGQSGKRGAIVLRLGAGRYKFTGDMPLMDATSSIPTAGLVYLGPGSDVCEVLFSPASGVSTSRCFQNTSSWYNVQVAGITFMSSYSGTASAGPAVSQQDSTDANSAAAQNWKWFDCKFRGTWRYGNKMTGDNTNSEWFHIWVQFGTNNLMAEGWIWGAMTTDQQVNIDFMSCQVLCLLGGKFIRMDKGGCIRLFGGQLLLNNGALAFDLRGQTHDGNGSTEFLSWTGCRTEIRDAASQVLYCEWPNGSVVFTNYTDNVIAETQTTFTFNPGNSAGPMVRFTSCYLTGRHEYRYAQDAWPYPHDAVYDSCRIPVVPDSFIITTFDSSLGATDNAGGAWPVEFIRYRGPWANRQRYAQKWTVNAHLAITGMVQLQTKRMRDSLGRFANGTTYLYPPANAEIVRIRVVKPADASITSTSTSWSVVLQDNDGTSTPTTLATISGTTTSKQWQAALNETVELGLIANTTRLQKLAVVVTNLPAALTPTQGWVEIDYIA